MISRRSEVATAKSLAGTTTSVDHKDFDTANRDDRHLSIFLLPENTDQPLLLAWPGY